MISPLPYMTPYTSPAESWAPIHAGLNSLAGRIMQIRQMKQQQAQFEAEQQRLAQFHADQMAQHVADQAQQQGQFDVTDQRVREQLDKQLGFQREGRIADVLKDLGAAQADRNQAAMGGLRGVLGFLGGPKLSLGGGMAPPQMAAPQQAAPQEAAPAAEPGGTVSQPPAQLPEVPAAPPMRAPMTRMRRLPSLFPGSLASQLQAQEPEPLHVSAAPQGAPAPTAQAPTQQISALSPDDADAAAQMSFAHANDLPSVRRAVAEYVRVMTPQMGHAAALDTATKMGEAQLNRIQSGENSRALQIGRSELAGDRMQQHAEDKEHSEWRTTIDKTMATYKLPEVVKAGNDALRAMTLASSKNGAAQVAAVAGYTKSLKPGSVSDYDQKQAMHAQSLLQELEAELTRLGPNPHFSPEYMAKLKEASKIIYDLSTGIREQAASEAFGNIMSNPYITDEKRERLAIGAASQMLGVTPKEAAKFVGSLRSGSGIGSGKSGGGSVNVSARGSATRDLMPVPTSMPDGSEINSLGAGVPLPPRSVTRSKPQAAGALDADQQLLQLMGGQ